MDYLEINNTVIEELEILTKVAKAPINSKALEYTSYFAKQFLGVQPRQWQHSFWRKLDNNCPRLIAVTSRQIGKSTAVALFALKAALYNTKPAGFSNKTHIGIISASEEQSKKLMLEIRRLIQKGDEYIAQVTNNKYLNYFSNKLDTGADASQTKTTITFKNGCQILSLPPTNRIRGYSFSYVFIDEAAFIDDQVFFEFIKPTVANTGGSIIMTTTPNGMQGYVYELFDPEEKLADHDYERMWVHYTVLENPDRVAEIEKERAFQYATGREKEFQQEYDALFTAQKSAFFDPQDVEDAIDATLDKEDQWSRTDAYMGIDFGMAESQTVITIVVPETENRIRLIYQYAYPQGRDNSLLTDALQLKEKYSVKEVIVDDCPQAHYFIHNLEQRGIQPTRFSFRSEKVSKYVAFRSLLRQKKIMLYKEDDLITQMKAMQQIETAVTTKIEKPSGGRDDRVDSLVIASYSLIGMDGNEFSSSVVRNNFHGNEGNNWYKDVNPAAGRVDTFYSSMFGNQPDLVREILLREGLLR